MSMFVSALSRPLNSRIALGAVLLDRAGIAVAELREGVTIIDCSWEFAEDVAYAIRDVSFGGNTADPAGPDFATASACVYSHQVDDGTFKAAVCSGKPVVIVAPQRRWPQYAAQVATRSRAIPENLADVDFAAVLSLVTGAAFDPAACEGMATYLTATLLVFCIRPGDTGEECLTRLVKLRDEQKAEIDKALADAKDVCEKAKADEPDAVIANADVVLAKARAKPKLSDVPGFGAAREWGLRRAADIDAYEADEIEWDDMDRGILLTGAPGVGKTFFVRLLAEECDVPLVDCSYNSLELGGGSYVVKAIAKKFEEARKKEPCIVFIDEVDSFGARGNNNNNESYWAAIINALLAELDGPNPRPGVIVIASTNYPDRVDPALCRPGRLERQVEIPLPTPPEIRDIVRHHAPALADADLEGVGFALRGRSPATIAMICRDARRLAREGKRDLTPDDIIAAEVAMRRVRDADEDTAVSIHEAGHAVAAVVLGSEMIGVQIDDQPHTQTVFSTVSANRPYVERHLVMTLAARRADAILGKGVTAGAAVDLAQATAIARSALTQWGMGTTLYAYPDGDLTLSRDLRGDVEAWLESCDYRAAKLVEAQREAILRVADALRERRYLDAEEVRALVSETCVRVSDS